MTGGAKGDSVTERAEQGINGLQPMEANYDCNSDLLSWRVIPCVVLLDMRRKGYQPVAISRP